MSYPTFRGSPVTRRRPALVSVRVIPWDVANGLYGILCEFDDGETFGEPWGSLEETRVAAAVRAGDMRAIRA